MISIKSCREIELMRSAGRIVAETLEMLHEVIKPGITTKELDRLAEEYIRKCKAIPSFLGYCGFPASICTSINEEVVHGIPENRELVEGDIISIDCGAIYEGYNGDSARTYPVGEVSDAAAKLIRVTKESFFKGMEAAVRGNRLSDIGHAVQQHVEANGFSVVRDYVGHGIGKAMHEAPEVPNYGPVGRGPRLVQGMTLAIEPMVNAGRYDVKTLSNQWTVVTKDKSLSAHYENTIVITNDRPVILTAL